MALKENITHEREKDIVAIAADLDDLEAEIEEVSLRVRAIEKLGP